MEDETESRRYIDQMWAEIMVLYRSGNWSLKLSPELSHRMDMHRLEFMAEAQPREFCRRGWTNFPTIMSCTRLLYNEALHQLGEPDRKSISEINDMMNNTIEGWLPGPSSHRFGGAYGTQQAWHRSDRVNEPVPEDCVPKELAILYEQEALPF